MKKALPPLDIEKFKEPRFSHGEALAITGLTADTLLTWHKRGVVPNVGERDEEGRGHRRKYSTFDLAYLAVLKQLAGKMPLVMAGMTAANAAGAIITTYDMFRFTETDADLDEFVVGLSLVAYENDSGQVRFEVIADREVPGLPFVDVQTWMRSHNVHSATVVDIKGLTQNLFANICQEQGTDQEGTAEARRGSTRSSNSR